MSLPDIGDEARAAAFAVIEDRQSAVNALWAAWPHLYAVALRDAADEQAEYVAWLKEHAQDACDRCRVVGAVEAEEMLRRLAQAATP